MKNETCQAVPGLALSCGSVLGAWGVFFFVVDKIGLKLNYKPLIRVRLLLKYSKNDSVSCEYGNRLEFICINDDEFMDK